MVNPRNYPRNDPRNNPRSINLRSIDPFALFLSLLLLLSAPSSAQQGSPQGSQTGAFLDQGGTVFNVKAYGATGNGTTDDTHAVQSAIDAANAAHGGIVYFPAVVYALVGTIKNERADIVSLGGTGMASRLTFKSKLGISLSSSAPHIGASAFHNGRIQGLFMRWAERTNAIAVQMTDMISPPQLSDLSVSNCYQGFDFINAKQWTERLVAINVSDDYNDHLFHYDQNPKNDSNSYGYGTYILYVNKSAGQDVFYLSGGAYLYHSTIILKGNIVGNATNDASIFHLQGAAGEPCPGASFNNFDIATEGEHYSVVKVTNSGCKGGAAGNPLVGGIGYVTAAGSTPGTNNIISDPQNASYLVATFTATRNPADTVKVTNASPGTKCYVQPTNAIAASAIVGTYVSGTNWGTVTVTHPPSASNGEYQIWCTP
jgi:hypothetical protein